MKGKVFSRISNLKGKKNSNKFSYKIEDHLPEELAEQQHRYKQIVTENRKLGEGVQQKMKINCGRLTINNTTFQECSIVNSQQVLKMDTDQLYSIQEIEVAGGDTDTVNGTQFTSFALNISSMENICKAYIHFKRKFSTATHISMVYCLPGIDKAKDERCYDDGEFSAGRRMLDLLIKGNHKSVMLVLV